MKIIETNALTRRFGDLVACDSLSISVEEGEIFGLLGPNGAGKTTAIKMLTTLLPPTSGNATVAGYDIVHHASDVRRVIGYVPQMLSADGTLTGYENLLIFAKLYDIPRREREKRIHDVLSFMGLVEESNRLVRTYSGGMIRRLEIAQSMMHRPKVLFLDEPTIGLDPLARRAVGDLIDDLRENYGATIFMTTHLMEEADLLCDRVAIMHKGKVAALGSPEELKSAIGKEGVTLEDVFVHFAGSELESEGDYRDYRETQRTRRTARRLG
ncbi:MAG: ATP-binding cassette domain-containing protein [Dehalococcoidia bacterium]|jgi:ABC-2 type transport system ATP-binding protein